MKRILQGLHSVDGVQGSMIVEGDGRILAHQAHALYDIGLLEKVSQIVANTTDSVHLLHDDWDMLTANLADGVVVLKNIRPGGAAAGRTVVLVLIADSRLNLSFAGVAIRVAATKLKSMLEQPAAAQSSTTASSVKPSAPDLASSGLSWSGLGASGRGGNDVTVVDAESGTFLTLCTKALATSVGPIAKVYVKEALRALCPERPFSLAQGESLIAELRKHIEDPDEAAQFQRQMRARMT